MCKTTYLFHVVAVDCDQDRVPADAARRPRGAVGAISVGSHQHVLTGTLDCRRGVPQLLKRVVLVGL